MKESCPICQEKFKLIENCISCGERCCSSCSIEKKCIDCYIKNNRKQEVYIYFKDKYQMKT